MDMDNKKFKNYAFISYSSKNTSWGKRLQRKLEHYRMPATLCAEHGWTRKPISPVWFAVTDILPGELSEELKQRLRESRNLIVICSPESAQSEWVGKEIKYFHELGRDKNIHFFIVDGVPNSGDPETECFNPVLKELAFPETLGANIHEKNYRCPWLNRERAYVQLISKLLNVEFDSIWKRHRRKLIANVISWTIGIAAVLAVMALIWVNNRPFDASIKLDEISTHNPNLPPLEDAVVTMRIDSDIISDTIAKDGECALFKNLPHKYLGEETRVTFNCKDFIPVDTVIRLGRENTINISRDPTIYGNITSSFFDYTRDVSLANTKILIEQTEAVTDNEGNLKMFIPLDRQKTKYFIHIPDYNVTDTITMPTNEYYTIGIN